MASQERFRFRRKKTDPKPSENLSQRFQNEYQTARKWNENDYSDATDCLQSAPTVDIIAIPSPKIGKRIQQKATILCQCAHGSKRIFMWNFKLAFHEILCVIFVFKNIWDFLPNRMWLLISWGLRPRDGLPKLSVLRFGWVGEWKLHKVRVLQ